MSNIEFPLYPTPSHTGCAVLAGYTGFFYYIYLSHTGPWTVKYDMPAQMKDRYKEIPEFASLFSPDSHPALKKNQDRNW